MDSYYYPSESLIFARLYTYTPTEYLGNDKHEYNLSTAAAVAVNDKDPDSAHNMRYKHTKFRVRDYRGLQLAPADIRSHWNPVCVRYPPPPNVNLSPSPIHCVYFPFVRAINKHVRCCVEGRWPQVRRRLRLSLSLSLSIKGTADRNVSVRPCVATMRTLRSRRARCADA